MKKILIYTREPVSEEIYSAKLAYSMHIAVEEEDAFTGLNHNSGVLYVKALEHEDGSLTAKSIIKPQVKRGHDRYYIVAQRIECDGSIDENSKGKLSVFETTDFVHYSELGLFHEGTKLEAGVNVQLEDKDLSTMLGSKRLPMGAVVSDLIEISDAEFTYLVKKLTTPENIAVEVPKEVEITSIEELSNIKAKALYSDGSECTKLIQWNDVEKLDFSKKGTYKISGKIKRPHFEFPIAINRADPCVARYNNKYYFIATNDEDNNHTLYIRESDTFEGLKEAKEHLILDSKTYEGIGGLLWAPEFHEIEGNLYIFHAATPGEFFCEESHIMKLKEVGNPINAEDWSRPKRITRQDGSDICEMGKEITLDMTCFFWEGEYYVSWSQRQFLPKDLGAWLYIAKLDPKDPSRLLTDPIVLSKPEYGWANNHTFVDEGPFALIRNDKVFLTFSSALVDSTYVVAMLTIEKGKDLLVRSNWVKTNYPLFSSRSVEGEYGTGHNAYVEDENGTVWNTYHARVGVDGPRSTGFRRVHFGFDNEPVLDMVESIDVKDEYLVVETDVTII